jgi:hypothetical protein
MCASSYEVAGWEVRPVYAAGLTAGFIRCLGCWQRSMTMSTHMMSSVRFSSITLCVCCCCCYMQAPSLAIPPFNITLPSQLQQHMQHTSLPLLAGNGGSSPIRAHMPGSPTASSSSVSPCNTLPSTSPHPPQQQQQGATHHQQQQSNNLGQALGSSSAGFPATVNGLCSAAAQNPPGPHTSAFANAAWASAAKGQVFSPDKGRGFSPAARPDGVITSPAGARLALLKTT